jgi:hypothetical protein
MEKYLQNIVGCFSGHCKQSKYAYKKQMESFLSLTSIFYPQIAQILTD